MDGIEIKNLTVEAIYKTFEDNHKPWIRMHVGASDIGKKCDREIWYGFYHVRPEGEVFDGRKLRLFQTGHREEARLVADLKAAGFKVWDTADGATGKQIEYTALDGHLVVHLDGVVLGIPEAPKTPHLLETKTASKKNFDKLLGENAKGEVDPTKRGVQKNKPEHYDQMQLCMGLAELERALYLVHCKDDERIYAERVNFDPARFKQLMARANRIIRSEEAPERLSNDPAYFYCKHFCSLAAHCHGTKMPAKNCRTCVHSSPGPNNTWRCANDLKMEPGCNEHLFRPSLFQQWATPVAGDPTWIEYEIHATKQRFVNVTASGFPAMDVPHYDSAELVNTSYLQIGRPEIEAAREILDGRIAETITK